MARFVKLDRGVLSPIWINTDRVVALHPHESNPDKTRLTYDDGSDVGSYDFVSGSPDEIAALLTDPPVKLHPSILVDDQPPAWAPAKPTDGGAE